MIIATKNPDNLAIPGFTDFVLYDNGTEEITVIGIKEIFCFCMESRVRIPKMEGILAQSARYSYLYALIFGRFGIGEVAILKSPKYSYRYAVNVIKGRWIEGEDTIYRDPECGLAYHRWVKDRYPSISLEDYRFIKK